MLSKEWIRPLRHLLRMFLLIRSVLAATLGWLGWQLLRQERELSGPGK